MARRPVKALALRELLVVIPHSGLLVPSEIPRDSLSEDFPHLLRNVDWYTHWLYNFQDLLDNRQLVFPYCSLLLEANRHPDILGDCVPLLDVFGEDLYRKGQEPAWDLRLAMSNKYLRPFQRQISAMISTGAEFLLDGHSTIEARGVARNQIDLMNYQDSALDEKPKFYSPSVYVETYAEELRRRLPDVLVTINASEYHDVYGHVCAEHSVDAIGRVGRQVPAICQETCQGLYMHDNGTPDLFAIDRLRRAFAESLHATLNRVQALKKPPRIIELRNIRQTYDFDCGVKALQGVLAYYGVEDREDQLLEELDADETIGTNFAAMIAAAERRGFIVEAGTNWTLDQVKGHLDQGHPVIVAMQAWADKFMTVKQWRENFDDGHYVVMVGYEGAILYFEDPASFHRTWLRESEFMARWHDQDPVSEEKLIHAALVLRGREPVVDRVQKMD